MKLRRIDQLRFGLMGLAKPESERTDRQRRLRTIVMCPPITRRFKPDDIANFNREQRYHAKRLYFIRTQSYSELIALASELVELDEMLSAAQDTDYLEHLEP